MTSELKLIQERSDRLRREIIDNYIRQLKYAMRNANGSLNPVVWWKQHAGKVADALTDAQLYSVVLSDLTSRAQLALQGAPPPEVELNPYALIGRNGGGGSLNNMFATPLLRVADAYDTADDVMTVNAAWEQARNFLITASATAISDVSRTGTSVSLMTGNDTMYIRHINPPTCARCLVLAGKIAYKPTVGFKRHPRCDCSMVSVYNWSRRRNDPLYQSLYFDRETYFNSLSEHDQNLLLGKGNAQAVRDGADMTQVVKARSGMKTVEDKSGKKRRITTYGMTKRGISSKYMAAQFGTKYKKIPGSRYTRLPIARLTPHEIYKVADGDRNIARVLLHKYGYITNVDPNLKGLWGTKEQIEEMRHLYEVTGARLLG